MSEIFKYLVLINHTQIMRTENFRDAHSLYETAIKEGRVAQVYQIVLDNDGIVHDKKK